MIVVDASIVNVALPTIQHELHFTQSSLTWVVDAYMISYGGFLLLAGRLGDLVGRKRVFLVGLVLFTLASAACGLADGQVVLIVARFVQGFGGAVCAAVIVAIVATEFPRPAERATAMSVYTFTAVSGGTIGLLLGGVIVDSIDWHWIFFINVPIGVLTGVLGRALIEESEGIGLDQGVDVLGALLGTASLMLGVYAIVKTSDYGWGSAHTLGFGAAALALLATFLVVEGRVRNPIMPLRILRLRGLMGSSVVRGLTASGLFTTFFLGALYLEHVRGYDAMQIGLAFLPMTLIVAVLSSGPTAWLVNRFGAKRTLVPGLAAMAAGLALLAGVGEHTAFFPTLFFAFALMGIGGGTSFMPAAHRHGRHGCARRRPGLGHGERFDVDLGLGRPGRAERDRGRPHEEPGRPWPLARGRVTGGYDLAFLIGGALVAAGIMVAIVVLPAGEREEREPEGEIEAALG